MVWQSSHLAAVPLEEPDRTPHAAQGARTFLVPDKNGVLEPHVPSMCALRLVREAAWDSPATCTTAHTLLAGACEVVPLGTVHHGPAHRDMLRARDGCLPTMQVMRRWRPKVTRRVIPALPCIFCGGAEQDTGHMRITCEWDQAVARSKVEEFTADLPLAGKAMEFMSSKEHRCKWTESLVPGVLPGDFRRLFAMVRAASSRDPAKAKLFLEALILLGEDGCARRNHRITRIMQLPPGDLRKATCSFLRGDTPFCPPAGRVWQLPPWNPFDGLPGDLGGLSSGTFACAAGILVVHCAL